MNDLSLFVLNHYLVYLLILTIIFCLGLVILSFFDFGITTTYTLLFWSFFVGLNMLVNSFAIICTQGKSIHLFFFLLLGFGMIYFRKKILLKKPSFKIQGKGFVSKISTIILLFFCVATIFFFWKIRYLVTSEYAVFFNLPNADVVFNSKISEYIVSTGHENIWQISNLYDTKYQGTTPYHYFELWLNAFVFSSFNLKSIVSLEIIVYPVAWFICFTGLLGLAEKLSMRINIPLVVFIFLLQFSKGVYIVEFLSNISTFNVNPFNFNKISFLYIFLIPLFYKLVEKDWKGLLLFGLLLPVVYFTVAAAILSGLCCFALCLYLLKRIRIGELFFHVSVCILFFLLVMSFYRLTGSEINFFNSGHVPSLSTGDSSLYLRTFINIIGGTTLQLTILYAIPALLLVILLWVERKDTNISTYILPFLFSVCIAFCALTCWAFFQKIPDAMQLFQNISIILIQFFFIFCFLSLYSKKKWYIIAPLFVLAGFNFTVSLKEQLDKTPEKVYSIQYMDALKEVLTQRKLNPSGISLFDKKDYLEGNSYYINHPLAVNVNVYVLGAQLKLIGNHYNTICISVFDTPTEGNPMSESFLLSSAFYQYTATLKVKGSFKSIEDSQIKFIDTFKSDYMIITKNVHLNELLASRVEMSIEDSLSGERFLILKK